MTQVSDSEVFVRLGLKYDFDSSRRRIANQEVIIHCHHYNARLQNAIEQSRCVDGTAILVDTADTICTNFLRGILAPSDTTEAKWQWVATAYRHLGFGRIDFSAIENGEITSDASHFVEGWRACISSHAAPVCAFTRGYLQAAIRVVTGKNVSVIERECMISDVARCRFTVEKCASPFKPLVKRPYSAAVHVDIAEQVSNIDESKIVRALADMPIFGGEDGLIPAFGVYLANMPADFYNLLCFRFIDEMTKHGLGATAKKLLYVVAETCGMNTIRGVLHSDEWEGLIAPMIREPRDAMFGIIAVTNGLGWGKWRIVGYEPGVRLMLASLNGYEACGYHELGRAGADCGCNMLSGVAAGIMELVSLKGPIEERYGSFSANEACCIARSDSYCRFEVEKS